MQMTQHYLPVHKKEPGNFSKIWYKKVHATTCILMHRSPKQWQSADKTIFQCIVDHEVESLEQVHDFKFLGSYKSADGDCTKEIKRRITLARQKAVVLASIWKDRNIKTATKVKVMKSMVWAVFQYVSIQWRMDFEEIQQKQNRSF